MTELTGIFRMKGFGFSLVKILPLSCKSCQSLLNKRFSDFFCFLLCRLVLIAPILLCAASGCVRSPGVTFYTLTAMAPEAATTSPAPHTVAVGPVTLPELIDRPQLVIRVAANRVDILETHRWAESLKSEIPRVLAENLARLLRPARVSAYQQNASRDAEYRVLVDIQRFETVAGAGVTIEALWSVRKVAVGAIPSKGRSLAHEPVRGMGYDALTAAHSRALAAISGEIAQALREEGK